MKRLAMIFVLLAGCQDTPVPSASETLGATDERSVLVRCGRLIDGLADAAVADRYVDIRDGRIVGVSQHASTPSVPFLDLSDYTCLPGLINTHTHLALLPEDASDMTIYYRQSLDEATQVSLASAAVTLNSGFTSVRNAGEYYPQAIYRARARIDAGEADGPRIRTAGPFLTIPGGGGDLVMPGHDENDIPAAARTGVASTPEEFAVKAQQAIDDGAHFLKVIASGAVFAFGGVPGAPEMNQQDIAAVVDVAQAAGLLVTAHVHSAQSARDAILAGVDSLEHASLLDDAAIELAVKHNVAFSMDVYNGTYTEEVGREQGYPEEFMRKNFETTEAQRVVFEKAHARGITILYGTDAGVLPHAMGAWQFGIMVERGMSPMDAIRSATGVAAEHMRMDADIGALQVGRYGDLIAVKGDPLADINVLKDVAVVIKGGEIIKWVMGSDH